jgi:hypothetical protein
MKKIEKPNGQIFEICTSRAEFGSYIKDILSGCRQKGLWTDDDSSLYLKYKSGREISFSFEDKLIPLNYNQIASGLYNNPSTQVLYNLPIVFNDHYGDWEVAIQGEALNG